MWNNTVRISNYTVKIKMSVESGRKRGKKKVHTQKNSLRNVNDYIKSWVIYVYIKKKNSRYRFCTFALICADLAVTIE